MRKRSISIKGHRTSILLEPEFWTALDDAARRRGVSLPLLIAEIDQARMKSAPAPGLASALRVFALAELNPSGARLEP
ncbi:MAG: aryl-sulfate sulfotransferase [Alphaproteobacteria bacterium RIFCSPHIGHO2_12_FULL_63_12]|nr:MAG: aryl-sulfate sulfotransferase [Alphaproteobacteria bacterium RIFCSPHIGHO2_12_FULL_63_12]